MPYKLFGEKAITYECDRIEGLFSLILNGEKKLFIKYVREIQSSFKNRLHRVLPGHSVLA